jgi:hypothetical protein
VTKVDMSTGEGGWLHLLAEEQPGTLCCYSLQAIENKKIHHSDKNGSDRVDKDCLGLPRLPSTPELTCTGQKPDQRPRTKQDPTSLPVVRDLQPVHACMYSVYLGSVCTQGCS